LLVEVVNVLLALVYATGLLHALNQRAGKFVLRLSPFNWYAQQQDMVSLRQHDAEFVEQAPQGLGLQESHLHQWGGDPVQG